MVATTKPIQFINSSCPGNTQSAAEQRRAHSHAAHRAHAKARRLRMLEYQAGRSNGTPGAPETKAERENTRVVTEKPTSPSPISLLASDRRDPFCSFARPFKPVEHFLLDHYVRAVLPYMNIHCNKLVNPTRYVNLMTREWVRLALIHSGSLDGIFLASCRHLMRNPQLQHYMQLALQYKLSCVQALRESLVAEVTSLISDSTITIGVFLCYDELEFGDLSTYECHLRGLLQMIEHNNGPETMGANGFLERLVSKFITSHGLVGKYKLQPW